MDANARAIDFVLGQSEGELIRVGIMDSNLDLPDSAPDEIEVRNSENLIAATDRDTTGHGTNVCNLLVNLAKKASIDLYRVVAEDKRFTTVNYLKALRKATENNVDVLNISAGAKHQGCEQNCRLCSSTCKTVEQNGMVVVVAAGNSQDDEEKEVMCPARCDRAIAVGGFVVFCTASPPTSNQVGPRPVYRAPGAYWDPSIRDCPSYCGQRGCTIDASSEGEGGIFETIDPQREDTPGASWSMECAENQREAPWSGNTEEKFNKPDILAPVHYPFEDENGEFRLSAGSSYAAPYVSGTIVNILGELATQNKYPDPSTAKRIMKESAKELDEPASADRLCVEQAIEGFLDHYNL